VRVQVERETCFFENVHGVSVFGSRGSEILKGQ
jgi:hypothetical protein